MDIEIEPADGHVLCRPRGELEAHNVDELRDALGPLDGEDLLVIDLSEVTFIDSAGLGCLIGTIRRAREVGGDVAIVSTRDPLTRILRTTGFDRIVSIEASADHALAAMRDRP